MTYGTYNIPSKIGKEKMNRKWNCWQGPKFKSLRVLGSILKLQRNVSLTWWVSLLIWNCTADFEVRLRNPILVKHSATQQHNFDTYLKNALFIQHNLSHLKHPLAETIQGFQIAGQFTITFHFPISVASLLKSVDWTKWMTHELGLETI